MTYALSLGFELKKEQLDVIVKYAMGRMSLQYCQQVINTHSLSTLQPQQLGEGEAKAVKIYAQIA